MAAAIGRLYISGMDGSVICCGLSYYTHSFRENEAEAVSKLPDFSLPSRESQKNLETGMDYANVTDSVLAFCPVLLCAGQSPTMPLGEKANAAHDIVSGVPERGRRDSNPQPSDDSPMLKKPKDRTSKDLQKTDKKLGQQLGQYLHQYPDLKEIINAWPKLPEHIKLSIITLAKVPDKSK